LPISLKIRDINDQINKLIREKAHWEKRIRELGGPDYAKTAPKILDSDGKEVKGSGGYLYFGAAKDLPGVKELFQKDEGARLDKKQDMNYIKILTQIIMDLEMKKMVFFRS